MSLHSAQLCRLPHGPQFMPVCRLDYQHPDTFPLQFPCFPCSAGSMGWNRGGELGDIGNVWKVCSMHLLPHAPNKPSSFLLYISLADRQNSQSK